LLPRKHKELLCTAQEMVLNTKKFLQKPQNYLIYNSPKKISTRYHKLNSLSRLPTDEANSGFKPEINAAFLYIKLQTKRKYWELKLLH
jgi:hypothetical protein